MPDPAQDYADRLLDTICECLTHCSAADDAGACAQEFVSRLRSDPTWCPGDANRIERVVMRMVDLVEPTGFKLRA